MTTDFQSFNLHPALVQAVDELGYEAPTEIQAGAIPLLMAGCDVLGQAQTGTGKTAAFALPMLHGLEADVKAKGNVQGLIVAPTRELAIQVAKAVYQYGRHRETRVLAIYGGQSYSRQIGRLRRGVDIVVGTPGRMLDLIRKGELDLSQVRYLVLDEADEMLSMGFIEDIEAILSETPEARQTALFSATLPKAIRRLGDRYMREPQAITVNPQQMTVAETEQRHYLVYEEDKLAALIRIFEMETISSALIFTRTKIGARELADSLFARGFQAEALHGDMSQAARETVMGRFRSGHLTILVATDVAARGLDIDDVSHVINYDIPFNADSYVHRIGRTGRAGKSGVAITLVTPRDRRRLQKIESYTMQPIHRASLPSPKVVQAHRDAHFLKTMQEQLAKVTSQELDLVKQMTDAGYDPLDIAAAAIQLLRAEETQRPIEAVREVNLSTYHKSRKRKKRGKYNRRSKGKGKRNRRHEPGMVRLNLDAGKAQGIRPRDVVGAIAGETGISSRAIGAIDIHRQETFVDVAEKHAHKVIKKMRGCRVRGKDVTLTLAE